MSKLTKALRRLSPLRDLESGQVPFRAEDADALKVLLTQIKSDRRQISQLNAKHQNSLKYITNLKTRIRLLQDQADADKRAITTLREELRGQRATIESISSDRTYWQGEARRLEEVKNQVPSTSSTEYVDPVQRALDQETARLRKDIKNDHDQHVAFHEAAEKKWATSRAEAEARDKLSRIAEIIGTDTVRESVLLAGRQLSIETVLVNLFDSKLKAVAEILDED